MNRIILMAILIVGVFNTAAYAGNYSDLKLSASASYSDENAIPANIRSECVELGQQFSVSTLKFLNKYGISADRKNELSQSDAGQNLILTISNAQSAGNAWIGHKKSVTIEAELYQDGKLIDSYSNTRNSGGGFGGGFKGSCSVLHRCVNALGKDVSNWLKTRG